MLLNGLYRFPGLAQVLLAANADAANVLQQNTGLPTHVIPPAVDTHLFSPLKRVYADGVLRIGYAGPLSPKNNVRLLVELERFLRRDLTRPFRLLIVGDGPERWWLQDHLNDAEFTGDLDGEGLARSMARMDIFAYPTENDASGGSVMKAMASGVPAVAMSTGAPRFLLENDVSGFLSHSESDFRRHVLALLKNPELRRRMGRAARSRTSAWTWGDACEALYRTYRLAVRSFPAPPTHLPMLPPNPIGLLRAI
jgi:phosphatidylinositol alpha 1,6-mannosyltransferase